jgi:hypothetical protein
VNLPTEVLIYRQTWQDTVAAFDARGHKTMRRRFPAPWREEKIAGGYVVRDANGQSPRVC